MVGKRGGGGILCTCENCEREKVEWKEWKECFGDWIESLKVFWKLVGRPTFLRQPDPRTGNWVPSR